MSTATSNTSSRNLLTGALALVVALGSAACVPQQQQPYGHYGQGQGQGRFAGTSGSPSASVLTSNVDIVLDGAVRMREGASRIDGRGAGAFSVTATAKLNRPLSPGEEITAVLIQGERIVRQGPLNVQGMVASSRVDVPDTGTYRLELWADQKMLVRNTFIAAALPTLDGQRTLVLHQDVAPRLEFVPVNVVVWSHWDSAETDEAFIAEWWHNDKQKRVVAAQRSTFQEETLRVISTATSPMAFKGRPVWRFVTERFTVPDEIARTPGKWELRVFRDNRAPIALGFTVDANSVARSVASTNRDRTQRIELDISQPTNAPDRAKELAKLPRTQPRDSATGLPITGAEIRGLTRSEILRTQRVQLNASFDEALVPQMRQLIGMVGKPWTDDERPN